MQTFTARNRGRKNHKIKKTIVFTIVFFYKTFLNLSIKQKPR